MYIFAWGVIFLSSFVAFGVFFKFIKYITKPSNPGGIPEGKVGITFLSNYIPLFFWLTGCVCYTGDLILPLPYLSVMGMALGAAVVFFLKGLIALELDEFRLHKFLVFCLPSVVAFVFFLLATVQYLWPHLITF